MGFGTGHHATTRLCLALLQDDRPAGRTVIDVGTGSGVLAIAARRLGASAWQRSTTILTRCQNARENIERNARLERWWMCAQADLSSLAASPADVVTANLTGAVLQRHAAELRQLVTPGGALIVSGFSPGRNADVVRALACEAEVARCGTANGPLLVLHVTGGKPSSTDVRLVTH